MTTRPGDLDEPACSANDLVTALCQVYLDGRPRTDLWPTTFRVGEVIADRYTVERVLARGGMGEVYEVFDRDDRCPRALKSVLSTAADSPSAIRNLHREALLARRVSNPHVCQMRSAGIDDKNPLDVTHFITMDLISGRCLSSRIEERALSRLDIQRIARQLIVALNATHKAGVLHRDVKSHNVIVSGEGAGLHSVLIDFGLARRMDGRHTMARSRACGSLGYMAPEQFSGSALTPSVDIYSFGIVLLEMLTGPLPSELRSRSQLRGNRAAHILPVIPSSVPAPLREIVAKCIRKDPEQRYASTEEVLAALDSGSD